MQQNKKLQENFYKKILSLKNKKNLENFFNNFFSQNELNEFANRSYVADLLSQNISYIKIQESIKISSRTIAKISKTVKSKRNNFL